MSNLIALAPNSSRIVASSDVILGSANIGGWDRDKHGNHIPEYTSGTDVHWDSQETQQVGGAKNAAYDLLAALKKALEYVEKLAEQNDEPVGGDCRKVISEIEAAIAKAQSPLVALFIDDDGHDWPENTLTFVDEDAFEAAQNAGYVVDHLAGSCRAKLMRPDGTEFVQVFDNAAAAWVAAIADMGL